MRKPLIFLALALGVEAYAQEISAPFAGPASNFYGFVQNHAKVQYTELSQASTVLFHSVYCNPTSYYTQNNISFVYSTYDSDTNSIDSMSKLTMTLAGEFRSPSTPQMFEETDEIVNYYYENYPSGCDNLIKHKGLFYKDIYPGIDMRIYSIEAWLKYYFVIKPDENPNNIYLNFDGHKNMSVLSNLLIINVVGNNMFIPSGNAYKIDANVVATWLRLKPLFALQPNGDISLNLFDSSKSYMKKG